MKLVQTQNPEIIPAILKWWRKFLSKINTELAEGDLNRLAECFKRGAAGRFFVLTDGKEIHGFATVMLESDYNSLFVMQVATDKPQEMHRALVEVAEKAGATNIYFATERSPRAWKKLLGAEQVGYLMKLPMEA